MSDSLRKDARDIWSAAVEAARPEPLVRAALSELADALRSAPRILVLGAGKAGAAMAEAVERVLADEERHVSYTWEAAMELTTARERERGRRRPTSGGSASNATSTASSIPAPGGVWPASARCSSPRRTTC